MQIAGRGLSASPVYALQIARWTSAGITRIVVGSVTLSGAFGLSGGLSGQSYAANGSLSAVQAGDLLYLGSSGADTAVTDLAVSIVIKATQDIKQTHGMS
jgi:hypothetical protein